MVTFLLSLLAIGGIHLMLYSAVALVQDKRLFSSAPNNAQAVIKPKPERFRGQHLLGWTLIAVSLLMLAAVVVIRVYKTEKASDTLGVRAGAFLFTDYQI